MTFQQLSSALALQKYKSYSRAAEAIGISQPALSIQIRKLEEQTGLNLFDRAHKKVMPTSEGLIFLDRAQIILTQVKQLQNLVAELNDEVSGEVRIGIIPTLAPYLLPLFIKKLHAQFPKLKIHVTEALTEEIIQEIKSGELDGGIISTPFYSKTTFSIIPLFYEGFKLFISPEHPLFEHQEISAKDIPIKDLWLLKEGNCFRDQVDNICEIARKEGTQSLFYFESNSIEALCRIVEFKGGITFLPELTTVHFNSENEDMIKELKGKKQVREISLVHLPKNIKGKKLERLIEVIQKNIPKKLLKKEGVDLIPTNIKV